MNDGPARSVIAQLRAGGAQAAIQDTCATADPRSRIYVAPGGSDSPDCGATIATACGSIQHGIDRCAGQGAGCGVLVGPGRFKTNATIALRAGISVYGSCVFDQGASPHYRTVVEAAPAAGTPAVSADTINTPTTISGLVIVGKDETALGAASVAMAVSNSSGLALRSMVLLSGQGGPGADGASATTPVGPGGEGSSALPNSWGWVGVGGRSCPSNPTTTEGAGGVADTTWFDLSSNCVNTFAKPGSPSAGASGGLPGTSGTPGIWCPNRPQDQPGDGTGGGFGSAGPAGARASASPLTAGSIVQSGWHASKGDDGKTGAVGAGGGGGGAGGSCQTYYTRDGYYGYAGGAGGGGGCGGTGGGGGQQGGASIALILSASRVDFSDQSLSIVAGAGGRGGKGGTAVSGGIGGQGGSGIKSGQNLYWGRWCTGLSGDGGLGGIGGSGSGGAGGNGGPSIGIALAGNSPAPPSDSGIYPGMPGNGGPGGTGGPGLNVFPPIYFSPPGPDGKGGQAGAAAAWVKY